MNDELRINGHSLSFMKSDIDGHFLYGWHNSWDIKNKSVNIKKHVRYVRNVIFCMLYIKYVSE